MLTFYLGQAKSGKKSLIFNKIKAEAEQGNQVILLVPEQFSFEAERELLNKIPDHLTRNISLLNFSTLANEIKRIYGGNTAKNIDSSTRVMFIHKALKSLKGEIKLFDLNNLSFKSIPTICNAIVELKQQAISSSQLNNTAKKLNNSTLAAKLSELSLIMNTYDSLLGNTFIDPIDELTFAYNKIKDNGYFKNKSVYVYGFTGFSRQQYKILKQAISDCDSFKIALCTNGDINNEFSLFANVNNTFNTIKTIAESINKKVKVEKLSSENYYNNNLSALRDYIVDNNFEINGKISINAISAESKFDELEYSATSIHNLVRTQNLRYRDFALIVRNASNYSVAAKEIFNKLNLPIYIDEKLSLSELPICNFILSALRASRGFKTKELYKFLKSGLTNISDDELNEIDNYVYMWNVDGKEWLENFIKNPYGLQEKSVEEIEAKLSVYNQLRTKIISPLIALSKLKVTTGAEYCREIYTLMDKCNVPKHLSEYATELDDSNFNFSQYLANGWNAINDIFDTIYICYGDETLTFKEFYDILSLCFTNYSLSGVPQGIDQVSLISADRIVSLDVKNTFVLGMNYGEFPAEYNPSGIFNSAEKGFLQGYEINLQDDYISQSIEEEYMLYKALTSASDSVCLLAHSSDYSNSCDFSTAYKQIVSAFNLKEIFAPNKDNIYEKIETPLQAVSVMSKNNDIYGLQNLLETAGVDSNIKELINNIVSYDSNYMPKLDKDIAKLTYGTELYISPSKLEQFYKCPYAYLFKYGLNISNREKIDFKFMQRGTIAHYVLEKIMCNDFEVTSKLNNDEIKIRIDELISRYIKLTVGENVVLDGEGKYLLKRIADMLYDLVPYVITELKLSKFKPIAFELKISQKGEIAPLSINEKVFSAKIGGIVDRVDSAEINGKSYIRIVDYKTGTKTFKMPDVLYGLNLQMLIYLCAICNDGSLGKLPAGIIYQPLNHVKYSGIDKKSNNAAKAKGVVLDDIDVISAMDPSGKFMPATIKADGTLSKTSSCLTNDEFQDVFKYVKQKFVSMCREIIEGEITPKPCNSDAQHQTCAWCDYKNICKKNKENIATTVASMSKDEVINIIKESVSDGIEIN